MWKNLLNIWKSNNLLDEAWQKSYSMLDIDKEMFLEAVHVLRESDGEEIRAEIQQKDKIVNEYERAVRRKVLTHCTVQGASAIPSSMVLVSIVIDIERLGDYTKNIVDLAHLHPHKLQGGKFEKDLSRIEVAVKDNFFRTKSCIEISDPELTMKLLKEYDWVNPLCDKCVNSLIMNEDKEITAGDSAALALYFRWLKRIYAHLRNIQTSAVNPFDGIGFKPGSY